MFQSALNFSNFGNFGQGMAQPQVGGGMRQMPISAPQQMPTPTQPGFAVGAPAQMPTPNQPGFAVGAPQQMPMNPMQGFQQNPFQQQMIDWRSMRPDAQAFDTRDLFRQQLNAWRGMRPDQSPEAQSPMQRPGFSVPGILSGIYNG